MHTHTTGGDQVLAVKCIVIYDNKGELTDLDTPNLCILLSIFVGVLQSRGWGLFGNIFKGMWYIDVLLGSKTPPQTWDTCWSNLPV